MIGFDFEEGRIKEEITKHGAKRVLLQLPEGLKPEGLHLAKTVAETGALPIISADPCYGACDIAVNEAEALCADLIIHFGHAPFAPQDKVSVVYIEAKATTNVETAVMQALSLMKDYTTIGLVTSVQHLQMLSKAKDILEKAGKSVIVGNRGQLIHAGQVIGCNYSNATSIMHEVDAFLFIGGGLFHALGVALGTSKPTIVADPYDNRALSINEQAQKMLKQRWANIEEAREANVFGVLIGIKLGQKHFDQGLKVKELVERLGKSAYLFASREITPDTVMEFPSIDAYVNTACPRISLEAPQKFSKPVLTVNEFMVAVGKESWENLLKKGLFES